MAKFYSVKEASLILGYSTNTLYKLLKEGRIKAARGSALQGRFKISHTALENFLQAKIPDDPLAALNQTSENTPVKKEFDTQPNQTQKYPPTSLTFTSILPVSVTRALVLVSLVLILIDLFLTQNFSFFEQALRLVMMGVIILLTYTSGTLTPKARP